MRGRDGRVAEWFKAPVLKTGVPARVPWVRIPPLPPCLIEIIAFYSIGPIVLIPVPILLSGLAKIEDASKPGRSEAIRRLGTPSPVDSGLCGDSHATVLETVFGRALDRRQLEPMT
jgi:hypothetical protein